jgi:hyperosmotically inducible periplasmic protein
MRSNFKMLRLFGLGLLLAGSFALASAQDATQQPPAPDNTKMNQGDGSSSKPTAYGQSNSQSDLKITQQIRQSIMKDKSLSTYAHNVKIITQNGMVTLKGPVRSDDEKQKVEDAATAVAGKDKVTSAVSVKPQQ